MSNRTYILSTKIAIVVLAVILFTITFFITLAASEGQAPYGLALLFIAASLIGSFFAVWGILALNNLKG